MCPHPVIPTAVHGASKRGTPYVLWETLYILGDLLEQLKCAHNVLLCLQHAQWGLSKLLHVKSMMSNVDIARADGQLPQEIVLSSSSMHFSFGETCR